MTEILKGEELRKAKEAEARETLKMIDQAIMSIKLSCHYITESAVRIAMSEEQVVAACQLQSLAREMDRLAKAALREGGN